jgi:pimeloyl-ACP methyl ester carboxylesterase
MLIGHSDGASIAAIYAGSTVDPRLNGLVLMAPHFFTEDIGLNSIRAMRETFRSTDLRARLARHHGHNVDCAFDGWSGAWLDPDFRAWDLRPFLPGIQVPTLIIQGRDDAYGTLAQVDTAVALIGARTVSVVLDHCGHAPQFEAKDATLTAIAEFAAAVGQKHGPA